mmetsp:Transcript_105180/g.241050  ORF Transcript_105180/g.241050 Transcript_105180/m.241050 type:complete len:236 (-) Transcript_105180:47-754(-)
MLQNLASGGGVQSEIEEQPRHSGVGDLRAVVQQPANMRHHLRGQRGLELRPFFQVVDSRKQCPVACLEGCQSLPRCTRDGQSWCCAPAKLRERSRRATTRGDSEGPPRHSGNQSSLQRGFPLYRCRLGRGLRCPRRRRGLARGVLRPDGLRLLQELRWEGLNDLVRRRQQHLLPQDWIQGGNKSGSLIIAGGAHSKLRIVANHLITDIIGQIVQHCFIHVRHHRRTSSQMIKIHP